METVELLRQKALDSMMKRLKVEQDGKDLEDGELPGMQSIAELTGQVDSLNREAEELNAELHRYDELVAQLIQQQTGLKEELKRVKDGIFQAKSKKFQLQARLEGHREQLQQTIRQLAMAKKRERERAQAESETSLILSPASADEKTMLTQRLATIEQELALLKARHLSKFDWRPYLEAISPLKSSLLERSALAWSQISADLWLPTAWLSTPQSTSSFFFPDLFKAPLPSDAPEWLLMLERLLSLGNPVEVVKQAMLVNAKCLDPEQWLLAWDLCHRHGMDPSPLIRSRPDHPLVAALCGETSPLFPLADKDMKGPALDELESSSDVYTKPFYALLRILMADGPVPPEFAMPPPLHSLLLPPTSIPPIVRLTAEQCGKVEQLLLKHCLPHRLHGASLSLMTSLLISGHTSAIPYYRSYWPACSSLNLIMAVWNDDASLLSFAPLMVYLVATHCSDVNMRTRLLEEQWHRLAATLQPNHGPRQPLLTPDQIMNGDISHHLSTGTRMLIGALRQNRLLQWSYHHLHAETISGVPEIPAIEWSASHPCLKPSFI